MSCPATGRRSFVHTTTGAVAAAGIAAAAWPLIHRWNPHAAVQASGDTLEMDLTNLQPAEQRILHWHGFPVFLVKRTAAMLDAMQERSFVCQLIDPNSDKRQQPSYAKNWHRSIDPGYAVLVGVCTSCACVPAYFADVSPLTLAGGYLCPCCASHYDPAGRVYSGLAQHNLPVPPHEFAGPSRIVLGKNKTDERFSLQTIERI